MQSKALEIASHIVNPISLVAFGMVFLGAALFAAINKKQNQISKVIAFCIMGVCAIPFASAVILAYHQIYHLSVVVLGPDNQPTKEAKVTATAGEEKETASGWEFDISPQSRPGDGKVTVYAADQEAHLRGSATVILDREYSPHVSVKMVRGPSVEIRGEVLNQKGEGVPGAEIVFAECGTSAISLANGLFRLNSCATSGQSVSLRARKGRFSTTQLVQVGAPVQLVLSDR